MTSRPTLHPVNATLYCFTCAETVPEPPAFELLDQENPCPACAERLLHCLDPILQMDRDSAEKPAGPRG